MDYLCELPNDAARRMALESLPPDLNSTYERILSRVNQSNPETQKLVRRALRWIANKDVRSKFTIEALCEAVSINFGSTRRNSQAIPDEFEILRSCGSLVRKSASGRKLELAHFTVQEFLQQIDPRRDFLIGAYRIHPRKDKLILAKVCLTYLNFEDFDQGGPFRQHAVERRFHEYPFRSYALEGWQSAARHKLKDTDLFTLLQKLLSPSKPNTLISLIHDVSFETNIWAFDDAGKLSILNSVFAEATALHYAAMYDLAIMCNWLLRNGCDVNRNTNFGTPLHFALLGWKALCPEYGERSRRPGDAMFSDTVSDTVDLLLESGADPNCYYDSIYPKRSPLSMALRFGKWNLAVKLLDRGGILDSDCLHVLETHSQSEDICKLVEHTSDHNVLQENRSRLLQLALRAKASNATRLMQIDKDLPGQQTHYEHVLRTAAEFGQVEIVIGLLEGQKLDIDAADESTGFSALHHAARNDQLEVAQILVDRGADWSRSDSLGRTALYHSVQGREFRCLQLFLQQDADTSLRDLEGMTVWHRVAQEGNIQALAILLSRPVDAVSAIGLKANDGRTPLLCASASGSKEAMRLLLSAGSSLTETASDGSSSIHYAARSGSLEAVKFLIGQAIDPCAVTHDDSNAIHYAVKGDSDRFAEIVHILLENGVDPCKTRNDGCTPLDDLVRMIKKEEIYESDEAISEDDEDDASEIDHLFAASPILLKQMQEKSTLASHVRLGSELIYLACSHNFPRAHAIVLDLLKFSLDTNIRFENGKTALMEAAISGNVAILSTLLLHGADPCINDPGLNVLHYACINQHKDILVPLRGTSIDWNSKATATIMDVRRSNVTALHFAAESRDSSVLEYLLSEDLVSNINACTDSGATPLFVAVWAGAPLNVSLLLSNGADTTYVDKYGTNPIHRAAKYGFEDVISEFIRHGSDLRLPNRRGLTPELVARKNGHETLAKVIMDYVNEQSMSRRSTPMNSCGLPDSIFSRH